MEENESRRSFITKAATSAAGLAFGLSTLNSCQFERRSRNDNIKVTRNGRVLYIELPVSGDISRVEIRLFSAANNKIIEYSDVSPFAPEAESAQTGEVFDPAWEKKEEMDRLANRELRFPVVDLHVSQDMEVVVEIDLSSAGEYCFNGNFYPEMHEIEREIQIPSQMVEHWENALLLDPKSNIIRSFYLRTKAEVIDSVVNFEFETLRDDWEGSVSVYNVENKELIGSVAISGEIDLPKISTGNGVKRERMIHALSWATRYILACKNTKEDSPTFGGQFLLYDLAAKTRLRSDWPWSWGPSAHMLLETSRIPELDVALSSEELAAEAYDIGLATLRQGIRDSSHPAFGLIRCTNEPGTTRDHGFDNRATPADTLHLVGWGWLPLYKATGDRRFLEAAEKVADVLEGLLDEYGDRMIPQAFNLKKMRWDDNMFFETSMGMQGLARLYMETGKKRHRDIMFRFVNMLLSAFEREDGLWGATLYGKTGHVSPCNYFTKSFAYCTEGLLAVHEAEPDRGYLERAQRITAHVLDAQLPDGSWSVRLERPIDEVGVTDKGTALWAYLFIRLYKATGDAKYLKAGIRALEWCMDNQYFGEDAVARGGIVGRSWPSGIIYRHWFDMVTTYTVSFFGNALAEALNLDDQL